MAYKKKILFNPVNGNNIKKYSRVIEIYLSIIKDVDSKEEENYDIGLLEIHLRWLNFYAEKISPCVTFSCLAQIYINFCMLSVDRLIKFIILYFITFLVKPLPSMPIHVKVYLISFFSPKAIKCNSKLVEQDKIETFYVFLPTPFRVSLNDHFPPETTKQ